MKISKSKFRKALKNGSLITKVERSGDSLVFTNGYIIFKASYKYLVKEGLLSIIMEVYNDTDDIDKILSSEEGELKMFNRVIDSTVPVSPVEDTSVILDTPDRKLRVYKSEEQLFLYNTVFIDAFCTDVDEVNIYDKSYLKAESDFMEVYICPCAVRGEEKEKFDLFNLEFAH